MSDDGDHVIGQYSDSNRAFLQSFMARGTLTFKEAQELLAAIFSVDRGEEVTPDEVTQADFESYLTAAADAISPFDYEIRSVQDQIDKERIYALVNSVSDPLTQMATTRTTEEIFYIRRFLDAMFETYNTKRREIMAISTMQALETKLRKGVRQSEGEASTQAIDKGLTGDQVEKLMAKLAQEKWLVKSSAHFYRLAPRALIELRSWLVDTYNDSDDPDEWQRIKFCEACKEIVTIGQRCADLECNVRLHNICEAAYWNSRPNRNCPKCDTRWDGKHYVGQKVITSTEEYLRGKRRSGGNKRARAPEEEAEEEEEVTESNGARPRRSRAQEEQHNGSSSRRKIRAHQQQSSPEASSEEQEQEEEEDDENDNE